MSETNPNSAVQTGLEVCKVRPPRLLKTSRRVGLLMNQASVDRHLNLSSHVIESCLDKGHVVCIFSPQHGIWGEQQANMIETPHMQDPSLGVPVHSLYSETRRPTAEMLDQIDLLVIDLQDVGTRVYTYIWTVMNCLQACAEADLPVLLLDRPNPLGGEIVEGPPVAPGYFSFVGQAPVPMRHGLTIGEMACWINTEFNIHAALEIVAMRGWHRQTYWPSTGLPWVVPSPNMPRFSTALVYPGQVLLEGTNLSEGRGTTIPFELIGAPYIDPYRLIDVVRANDWNPAESGLMLRPTFFQPTFDKWNGQRCGGVALHAVASHAVRSYTATVRLLAIIEANWPNDFAWLPPPYEYETQMPPIDILSGDDRLRQALNSTGAHRPDSAVADLIAINSDAWWNSVRSVLIYG